MRKLEEEYKELIMKRPKKAYDEMIKFFGRVANSALPINRSIAKTQCIPKIYNREHVANLKYIAEFTHGILVKIIEQYQKDEEFRKLFGFDKTMEEMMLLPAGYDSVLPMLRVDIFYNEDDGNFKFCEFNTDGTSAMNEDRILNVALAESETFKDFCDVHKCEPFELFDTWVEEVRKIYDTYKYKVDKPRVGIVDFKSKSSMSEFNEFVHRFKQAGFVAEFCDIEKAVYIDEDTAKRTDVECGLYSESGAKLDIIYRRAVTSDVYSNLDKVQDFMQAVKDEKVCLIGAFKTQAVHNKILYEIMCRPDNLPFLTEEEHQFLTLHVPKTYRLVRDCNQFDLDKILTEKDGWIIKPLDSYGSKNVYAGITITKNEWQMAVNQALETNGEYILQEFHVPYVTENIDFVEGLASETAPLASSECVNKLNFFKETTNFEKTFDDFRKGVKKVTTKCYNLSGLYVYNGEFKGVYSRVSKTPIISSQYNEIVLPGVVEKVD